MKKVTRQSTGCDYHTTENEFNQKYTWVNRNGFAIILEDGVDFHRCRLSDAEWVCHRLNCGKRDVLASYYA